MKTRQKVRISLLLIAFFLFPAIYYYFSPYLIIDATLSRAVSGSFLLFFLQFLSALVIGRAFCGWICPAAGAQETVMMVSQKKVKRGNLIKWFIWFPWIGLIIFLAFKNGGYTRIDPTYKTTFGLSIDNVYALITYLMILLLIVLPSFIFGKRSFCHHLCWMAPFMILGRKIRTILRLPALQLTAHPEKCISCGTCTEKCPMSLEVQTMVGQNKMEKTECIVCFTCVDVCKNQAIKGEFRGNTNR